jgi:hypothetical protein
MVRWVVVDKLVRSPKIMLSASVLHDLQFCGFGEGSSEEIVSFLPPHLIMHERLGATIIQLLAEKLD